MNAFTIKDLENLTGIKAHTIRIWEQRYQFLKPKRTDTNIRFYTNDELKKVLNIALLNKYGYKISHIDKMGEQQVNEKLLSLNQIQAQHERLINDLIKHMIELDTELFEELLDNFIIARGVERAINQIIFPFLEKIGILWLTNHINPGQEHIVTNIIRQKIIVGIESISTSLKVNKTVLLFLPEAEFHEISLLFMYFIFKSRGINVIYLGANVPLKDVDYVIKIKKPDFVYAHITAMGSAFNFEKFILNAVKLFQQTPFVISGNLTHSYAKKIPPTVNFKKSFAEVMEFVSQIK
jgi:MerR family transcriptional regulator, light-induced transcriptional regulator